MEKMTNVYGPIGIKPSEVREPALDNHLAMATVDVNLVKVNKKEKEF